MKAFLVIGLLLACSANAYEIEKAKANMAQDLMFCMQYYNFWSAADKADGKDSTSMDKSAMWALNLAQLYEPSIKKLDAMAELAANQINKVSKEEGATRLVLTHAESCKAMLEHPVDRFNYWQEKK